MCGLRLAQGEVGRDGLGVNTTRSTIRCDVADTPVADGELRLDRSTLHPSKRRDDGSWVYEAHLAYVGRELVYAHGREIATKEALSDATYLDSLKGLAVVARHPKARRVDITKPGTYREVGTILDARWDDGSESTVIEMVVREVDANKAIRELGQTGVSEGYAVTLLDASTNPARQLGRRPNHVALTLDDPPRMAGAHVRVDHQEHSMELAALLALLSGFGLRTDSAEKLHEDLDKLKAAKKTAEDEKVRADAAEERVEKFAPLLELLDLDSTRTDADIVPALENAIAARSVELAELRLRADALSVELPAEAKTVAQVRKALALALKPDGAGDDFEGRCDSADFCSGLIASASASRADSSLNRARSSVTSTPVNTQPRIPAV